MNFKTTIILVLLLALAGGYLYFVSLRSTTTREQEQQQASTGDGSPVFTVDDFDGDAIAKLTVQQGTSRVVLEKQDNTWWQTQPVRFPLYEWSASDLVRKAVEMRYAEKFTPGEGDWPTLDQLQLTEPAATITITQPDHPEQTIKLGKSAVGGRAYVMVDGRPEVYVVSSDLHRAILEGGINEWRRKSLTAPTEGAATKVSLTQQGETVEVIKSDGRWSLGQPHAGRASTDAVRELLSAIGSAYIGLFVADQPADLATYGLNEPSLVLQVLATTPAASNESNNAETDGDASTSEQPGATAPVILSIGSPADLKKEQYFATFSQGDQPADVVFTISAASVDKFRKTVDQLRDARLTPLAAADIHKLALQREGSTAFTIERKPEGGWTFSENGPDYGVETEAADTLLKAITDGKASSYAIQLPADEPEMTVTLTAIGRSEPDVLKIYSPTGDGEQASRLVVRNNETVGYVVTQDQLKLLDVPVVALRSRVARAFDRNQLHKLVLETAAGRFEFTRPAADEDGQQPAWRMDGFSTFETAALNTLLDRLATVKVDRWHEQLNQPSSTAITLTVQTATDESVLKVDPQTRVATLTGVDTSFEASQALIDALTAEFRPRTVLDLGRQEIASLVISEGEQSWTLTSSDGKFSSPELNQLDQKAAAGLFDTLPGLRAHRFVEPAQEGSVRTITIKLIDGPEQTIGLINATDRVARTGDRWFTLDQSTWDKLAAPLAAD